MANLSNTTKIKLVRLLRMDGGNILDLSITRFTDFVKTSVGIDIYAPPYNEGSKATRLRQFWQDESNENVVKLSLELLGHAEDERLMKGESQTLADAKIEEACKAELGGLIQQPDVTDSDLQFLGKEYGNLDLAKVPVALDFQEVIRQRIGEIEKCLAADAPLAVIFLAGSTLEGLLSDVSMKNISSYMQCKSAPKNKGVPVPITDWTLDSLITTSHELGIVGQDVVKFAHAVKDFRNYIHPRQQIKDKFSPRKVTAKIAYQVLQAAIADLSQTVATKK